MDFKDIELKIFKNNIKLYRLYFISNIIATAIFYVYAAIFTNDDFMNECIVNSMISSNIGVPSVIIAVFIMFYIPYSYNTFNKFRKIDFAIFLSIGMSEKRIRKITIVENTIIELVSLFIGLLLGTILSTCFYLFLIKVLKMKVLNITFNPKSYLVTILLFLISYILTLIGEFISEFKYSVIDFLKVNRCSNEGREGNIIALMLGLIIISCAIIVMFIDYDYSQNNILISMAMFFIGLYIVFLNSMVFISLFKRLFKKTYYKNLIFLSNLKHDFSRIRRVIAMMMILIAFSEFMLTLAITSNTIVLNYVDSYNPYDIEYASGFNKNMLEQSEIYEIVNSGDTTLKEEKEVCFLRNGAFTIFSLSDINKKCNRSYSVEEGKFILIFPYDMNDGSNHEKDVQVKIPKVLIEGQKQNLELKFQESNIDIIFGDLNSFALYKIIVSDEDFNKIKNDNIDYHEATLHLFSFEDWRKTGSIVNRLEDELLESNNISDLRLISFHKVGSKIENYASAKQSGIILIIILILMSILLILAANVVTHFKLVMDLENETQYYNSLRKMGMNDKGIEEIIEKN